MPYGIKVENKDSDTGEILVYGYITDEKWMDTDVTPKDFKDEMDKLKGKKTINVRINSVGGGVFAGIAIHNILKRSEAVTNGYVDGIAASIASVILQGCKNRVVTKNSLVMIHNPTSIAMGEAKDFRKMADTLDVIKESIVSSYVERTIAKEDELRSMMDAETWMTGEEAVEFGFADTLEDGAQYSACLRENGKVVINGHEVDISNFRSFPKDKIPKETPVNAGAEHKTEPDFSVYQAEIEFNSN